MLSIGHLEIPTMVSISIVEASMRLRLRIPYLSRSVGFTRKNSFWELFCGTIGRWGAERNCGSIVW